MIAAVPPSSTTQAGATGSPAPAADTVQVTTPNGHTPIPGVEVAYAITAGTGDFTAPSSATQVTSLNTVTNASGKAFVGSWILGLGANTATATATDTATTGPAGSPGIAIVSSPVTFTATGAGPVVPYAPASGPAPTYQYYLIGTTPPGTVVTDTTGFSLPSTTVDANWGSAASPFGNTPAVAATNSCPLEIAANVDPLWTNNPSGALTYFLVRKSFTLPVSLTSGTIKVGIAVDNDVEVFLDGTNITTGVPADSTFVRHDGCPAQDSFVFSEPLTALTASASGTHLLAIMARDRGGTSYIDAQVTVTQP